MKQFGVANQEDEKAWFRPRSAGRGAYRGARWFVAPCALLAACSGSGTNAGAIGEAGAGGVTNNTAGASAAAGASNVTGNGSAGTPSQGGTQDMGTAGAPPMNSAGAPAAGNDSGGSGGVPPSSAGAMAVGGAGGLSALGGAGTDAGGSSAAGGVGGSGGAGGTGTNEPLGAPHEETLESLDEVRQEHAVVAVNGEVYVIGGYVSNQLSDSVQAYDPELDSWRDVEGLPMAANHPNAGVVDEKIYVAGFYVNGMTTALGQVLEYDPLADEWTNIGSMPAGTDRAASCVTVDAGYLYVLGGAHDGMSVAESSRFAPATGDWEELPALPAPREHCVAGAIGGTIYVVGGRIDTITGIGPESWKLEPGATEWIEIAPLPIPRGGHAGAVLHGRLVVFGGEGNEDSPEGIFDNIDVYDPTLNTWTALPPMIVPRHGYGAAVLGDRIYLAGGAIEQGGVPGDGNSVFYFE